MPSFEIRRHVACGLAILMAINLSLPSTSVQVAGSAQPSQTVDSILEARIADRLGRALQITGRHRDAITQLRIAAASYDKLKEPSDAALAWSRLGECYRDSGDDVAAAAAFAESISRFQSQKKWEQVANDCLSRSEALGRLKRFPEAAQQMRVAADAMDLHKDNISAAWCWAMQGDFQRQAGDFKAAEETYAAALSRFTDAKSQIEVSVVQLRIGSMRFLNKQYAEALNAFEAAGKNTPDELVAAAGILRGNCFRELKEFERAKQCWQETAKRFEDIQLPTGATIAYRYLGDLLDSRGQWKESLDAYDLAVAAAQTAIESKGAVPVSLVTAGLESTFNRTAAQLQMLESLSRLSSAAGKSGNATRQDAECERALRFLKQAKHVDALNPATRQNWHYTFANGKLSRLALAGSISEAVTLGEELYSTVAAADQFDIPGGTPRLFALANLANQLADLYANLKDAARSSTWDAKARKHLDGIDLAALEPGWLIFVQQANGSAASRSKDKKDYIHQLEALLSKTAPIGDESLPEHIADARARWATTRVIQMAVGRYPFADVQKAAELAREETKNVKVDSTRTTFEALTVLSEALSAVLTESDSADGLSLESPAISALKKRIEATRANPLVAESKEAWILAAAIGMIGRVYEDHQLALREYEEACRLYERTRGRAGGTDAERFEMTSAIVQSLNPFVGLAITHLNLKQPEAALAALDRGRTRVLRELLQRGQQFGTDIFGVVERQSAAGGDEVTANMVREMVKQRQTAKLVVATLEPRLAQQPADPKSDRSLEPLKPEEHRSLNDARDQLVNLERKAFNLATNLLPKDATLLDLQATQQLLGPRELLLVYAVSESQDFEISPVGVFIVPPAGQKIEYRNLHTYNSFGIDHELPRNGIFISQMFAGGKGDTHGVRLGDVIQKYNDTPVTYDKFRDVVLEHQKSGKTEAVLELWRNGETINVKVPSGLLGIQINSTPRWAMELTAERLRTNVSQILNPLLRQGDRGATVTNAEKKSADEMPYWSHQVFDALIPPDLWQRLRELEVVHIVAGGSLQRVPFELLVPDRPKWKADGSYEWEGGIRYWLDVGPPIAYSQSVAVFADRRRAKTQQIQRFSKGVTHSAQVVALGDAIYGDQAHTLPVPPEQGCVVTGIAEGSTAGKAGVAVADVILRVGQSTISDATTWEAAMKSWKKTAADSDKPADNVVLEVWRFGTMVKLSIPRGDLGVEIASEPVATSWPKAAEEASRTAERSRRSFRGRYSPQQLRPLPGTAAEVQAIRRAFVGDESSPDSAGTADQVRLLVKEEATRTNLWKYARGARFVHIATHGIIDESDHVSWSSLATSTPATKTPDDLGFITLQDLFQNWGGRLADTELVVLSACDSQRGKTGEDEGVFGLPWGFMFAGSPAVVSSLWQVDDASTADLMRDYYERLKGLPADASANLEPAKLRAFVEARRKLKSSHPSPYFWAPFIYLGDPR